MGSFIPFISHLQVISQHYLKNKTILHLPPNYEAHNNISDVTDSKHQLLKRKRQNLMRVEKIVKNSCSSRYKCCGIDFKCFSKLKEHKKTLAHRGLVLCKICNEVVKKEDILKHRVETHKQIEEKWKCEACHKCFDRKGHFTRHLNFVKGNLFTCSVCLETFNMRCSYTVHCKSHHASSATEHSPLEKKPCQNEMAAKDIVQGPFKCCGLEFKYISHFENHKKTLAHRGLVFCQICSEVVKKEDILKHRAEIHKPYKCCGIYFKYSSWLKEHLLTYAHQSVVLSQIGSEVVQKYILEHKAEIQEQQPN